MRYLLLLLVIGCTPLRYFPEGDMGTKIPYMHAISGDYYCYKCKEKTLLFKVDSKKRVVGYKCYLKYFK